MTTDLTTEVARFESDNVILKTQISYLRDLLSTRSSYLEEAVGQVSFKPFKDAVSSSLPHQSTRNARTCKNPRNSAIYVYITTGKN